jgi:hypothetical protein
MVKRREQYALTNSKDQIKRVSAVIPMRLTLNDIAVYITSREYDKLHDEAVFSEEDRYVADLNKVKKTIPSRRKAIEMATNVIIQDGEESPHYRVGDNNLDEVRQAVLAHLEVLWA